MEKIAAIIPAGGIGKRMKINIAKQFIEHNGYPVLYYTLKKFYDHPAINLIVIPVFEQAVEDFNFLIKKWNFQDKVKTTLGGKRRQDSVWNALQELPKNCDYVLVHDAVRPFLSKELIVNIMKEVKIKKAVIPVVPVKDTIKIIEEKIVRSTPRRDTLASVQTPQAFDYSILFDSYQKVQESNQEVTDEAMSLEYNQKQVFTTEGEDFNIKITTQEDLKYLKEKLLV